MGTKRSLYFSGGLRTNHIVFKPCSQRATPSDLTSSVGLVSYGILYIPTRKEFLPKYYPVLRMGKYPLTGASDHGVSEALYLEHPAMGMGA